MPLAAVVSLPFDVLDAALSTARIAIADLPAEQSGPRSERLRENVRREAIAFSANTTGLGVPPDRPVPLPAGPVETTANRTGVPTPALYGGALLGTRDQRRALGLAAATTATSATAGRETFTAMFSQYLTDRSAVAIGPRRCASWTG